MIRKLAMIIERFYKAYYLRCNRIRFKKKLRHINVQPVGNLHVVTILIKKVFDKKKLVKTETFFIFFVVIDIVCYAERVILFNNR